jgi:hypothetical protein
MVQAAQARLPAPPQPIEADDGLNRADARFLIQMRRALSHTAEPLAILRKLTGSCCSRWHASWQEKGSLDGVGSGGTTGEVLYLLKGADTSINGVPDTLNTILRLIRDLNCLIGNLTNLGLATFEAISYVFQTLPYLFSDSGCE